MTENSRFAYNRGDEKGDVVFVADSGAVPGADLRVEWDDALAREEIIIGLAVIEQRILETDWPPAP